MQFKFQRDFIIRRAMASDQNEVLGLIKNSCKSHDNTTELAQNFLSLCQQSENFCEVALNSNGVVIAFVYATDAIHTTSSPASEPELKQIKTAIVHKNFKKKELIDALTEKLIAWNQKNGHEDSSFVKDLSLRILQNSK